MAGPGPLRRVAILGVGLLAALVGGCTGEERAPARAGVRGAEVSLRPERSGRWELAAGATLVLERSGELRLEHGGETLLLATDALELPAIGADGTRVVFAFRRPDGFTTAIGTARLAGGHWRGPRIVVDRAGTPDRVALAPDGQRIAFVDAADGIAALWLVPFAGGAPTQLTNRGLRRDGPGPPRGFVPVPSGAPPRFDGDRLVWEADGAAHSAVVP